MNASAGTPCSLCGRAHGPNGACAWVEGSIGKVLGEKYRLERLLGRGGMGVVFEARHVQINKRVAIKFLLPQWAANPEVLQRFQQEAEAAGQIEAQNIASVLDIGASDEGAPYIVMEFLRGEDCASLLAREGRLPVARAVSIIMQACRGLSAAHQLAIIHRDLKPENLFLTQAGDGGDLIKILDFGIAKLTPRDGSDVGLTKAHAVMGTIYYMAPEQARGSASVDLRADIYSLGVILYELLSGQKPHTGRVAEDVLYHLFTCAPPPLGDLRPELPKALVDIVARAMATHPAERFASAMSLGEALAPFATGDTLSSQPTDRVPQQALTETAPTPESQPPAQPQPSSAPPDRAPLSSSTPRTTTWVASASASPQPPRSGRSRAIWRLVAAGAALVVALAIGAQLVVGASGTSNFASPTLTGAPSTYTAPAIASTSITRSVERPAPNAEPRSESPALPTRAVSREEVNKIADAGPVRAPRDLAGKGPGRKASPKESELTVDPTSPY